MYSMSANPISYASQTPILYVTYQTRLRETYIIALSYIIAFSDIMAFSDI